MAKDDLPDPTTIGDPNFFAVLSELAELHSTRAYAYGIHDAEDEGFNEDPLAPQRYASPDFGIKPWVYELMRANENMRRLQSQIVSDEPRIEHMRKCFMDIASHAITAMIFWEEDQEMYAALFEEDTEAED